MNPSTETAEPVVAEKSADELEQDLQSDTLTANDRCDSCGSQAYVHVELPTGGLDFCNHHYTEIADKLAPIAISITNETWKLYKNTKLDVSA